MGTQILYCILAGIGFSMWPLIAKAYGPDQRWVGLLINLSTMVISSWGITKMSMPTKPVLIFLIFGGVMNGLAFWLYSGVISNKTLDISVAGPVTTAMLQLSIMAGGVMFIGEPLNTPKVIGFMAVLLAIYCFGLK